MQKFLLALVFFAIFASFAGLAIRNWRARAQLQSAGFSAPAEVLSDDSKALAKVNAQYVATTVLGDPLNRVNAYGLGIRGKASISLHESGIAIDRKGERSLAIALASLDSFEFAQATIDRVVERDGLLQINWNHEQNRFSTFLRISGAGNRKTLETTLQTLAIRKATK